MSPTKSRRAATGGGQSKAPPPPPPELRAGHESRALAAGDEREARREHRPRPCSELQYAVKLVQGSAPALTNESFIAPGRYFTATNVHNPSTCKTVTFRFKVALADVDGAHVSTISAFREATLRPDEALEIDARDVTKSTGIKITRFVKGFVVIESPCELDVVAVYTAFPVVQGPAGALSSGIAFHTERVPARKIESCLDLDLDVSTGVADWTLTYSSMPALNVVPCQAVVIPDADTLHNPQWALQPGSRWISARGGVNAGPAFAAGWYVFQTCFTLCSGFTWPVLDMKILVDDVAWIRLNGQWIAPLSLSSPHVPWNLLGPPKQVTVVDGFLPGRNCLEVFVFNGFNDHKTNPLGLNVLGRLTAERGACPEGCGCGC
jgi:hypothetical protein